MHGFRRAIAGDVLELTRGLKLALDWIGTWISGWPVATCARATRALKKPPPPWIDSWERSATETVTDSPESWNTKAEASGELALAELGREDSNLQLPG
jgi:hypothetical protein